MTDLPLGAYVAGAGPRAVAADGGRMAWTDTPDYTDHVEPAGQGGEPFVRCEGCGRELLVAYGGREKLPTSTAARTRPPTSDPASAGVTRPCGHPHRL